MPHRGHRPLPAFESIASPERRELLRRAGITAAGAAFPGLLASCGGGSDAASEPTYAATIAAGRQAIYAALATTPTPAITVALVDRSRLLWAEAFGSIDPKTRQAPTPDTLFCIGSCSKMVATAAAMILVDRGQVELDAPFARYVPEFRMIAPDYARITLRMLLNHSAGLPGTDYRHALTTDAPFPDYYRQVLATLASTRLKHDPGAMSVYANDGFTLVQALVPAVTGLDYPSFVAREIFAPLHMDHSRFALQAFAEGSYAPGFDEGEKLPQEFANAYGSGGLYTTPTDLGRFAQMLINGGGLAGTRVLSQAAVTAMAVDQTVGQPIRPVVIADGYGLGWDGVLQQGLAEVGVTCWHKGGSIGSYQAEFFVLPGEGLAVAIIGTSNAYEPGRIAERILLTALAERGSIATVPVPYPRGTPPAVDPNHGELAAAAGVYAAFDRLLRLDIVDGRSLTLSRRIGDAWKAVSEELLLRADGTFASANNPDVAYSLADAAGERYLVVHLRYGLGHYRITVPYAQRIAARPPLSAAWRARLSKRWLVVNDWPDSETSPLFTLAALADYPGYVLASAGPLETEDCLLDPSGSDVVAQMCLKIPYLYGRDLNDVTVELHGDEEWIRTGGSVFRPEPAGAAWGTRDAGDHQRRLNLVK